MTMVGSITDLPDHILTEILWRVPARSIFSCRCVCKTWFNLTPNDSHFAELHFSKSQVELMFQFRNDYGVSRALHFVDPELDTTRGFGAQVSIKPRFYLPDHKLFNSGGYRVLSSCRGLLCLLDFGSYTPCIVSNPITGEYIMLPNINKNTFSIASGFGFCPSTKQYKVLNFSRFRHTEIHVVGSDLWRAIDRPSVFPSRTSCTCFLSGALHWACDVPVNSKFIVSFNFEDEKFGEIPPPTHLGKYKSGNRYAMNMGVLGNCLYVCDVTRKGHFDVWVMKEYGVPESWSKDFVVHIDAIPKVVLHCGMYRPLKCLNNGELLMIPDDFGLECYDPLKKSLRCLKFQYMKTTDYEAFVHTPSLVSLKDVVGDNVEVLNVRSRDAGLKSEETEALLLLEYSFASHDQNWRLSKSSFSNESKPKRIANKKPHT